MDYKRDAATRQEPEKSSAPTKRRRVANQSTMLTMLMICLMLPLVVGNPVEVQPFTRNPEMYFEKLGAAGITASEWNVISYIDMQHYWKKFEAIKKYPAAIQRIANGSLTSNGKTIVNLLEGLINEIALQNHLLQPRKTSRTKRGAFNVVGNIANALFGVLDTSYAEEAEKMIEGIKQNQNYLVDHMRNQTSFIDTTINILKKNQREMHEEIEQISRLFNSLTVESITEISIQATLDILQLERIQDSLIETLVSSHHGKISPELISPVQLQTELNQIKANLPNHLKLPAATDELLNFYKLMTIEGKASERYVIFKIIIPLLVNEDFEILKVASIPWLSNGTFYQIKPTFSFLVINLHRDHYLPLKESELIEQQKSCLTITNILSH